VNAGDVFSRSLTLRILPDVARQREMPVRNLDVDVRRPDPMVRGQPLERRDAYLIIAAARADGGMDLQVVDDYLEDALDVSCVVRRGEPLWERRDSPAQDDGADLVHRHGDQLGMFDARIALERDSDSIFYAMVGEQGGAWWSRCKGMTVSVDHARVSERHSVCVIQAAGDRITQSV
jgi:hypothetical protein